MSVVLALVFLFTACAGEGHDTAARNPNAAEVAVEAGQGPGSTDPAADPDSVAESSASTVPPGTAPGTATTKPGRAAAPKAAPQSTAGIPGGPGTTKPMEVGKGISATTIKLGVVWADTSSYNAGGASLGGDAGFYEPPDPKDIQNAIIEHVNRNGGIAGRKIEPVWHELLVQNAVTKEGRARDAQQACAAFTEDNKVFAMIGSGQWTEPNITDCAARTQTPYVDTWGAATGLWLSSGRAAAISDFYYQLSGMTTERRERALAQSLTRQRFFGAGAKVGIITEDAPSIRDGVTNALKPALAAAGVQVASEVVYPDIIESPWPNYVLQFQAAGITHVVFSASTGASWPTLLFMRAAENQGYRPRYGIDSLPVDWLQTNAPATQLANAAGVSWLSGRLREEFPVASENDRVCRQIMKSKGHPEDAGYAFCDFFFFLKAALEKATALTPAGMAGAAEAMGDTWSSTYLYEGRTRFRSRQHDAAVLVRDFAWDRGKGSMQYTSGTYDAP